MSTGSNYALMDLADSVGQAARRTLDARAEKKRMDQLNRDYAAAMARGARTGDDMPAELAIEAGQIYTLDAMTRQTSLKVVAIRELKKFSPLHPLVSRQGARNQIARKAVMNMNAAGRSMQQDIAEYAPTDEEAQEIYRAAL